MQIKAASSHSQNTLRKEHHAFMYKEHMEYTTCEKAIAGLLDVMGPVHGVDWGCYFSETKNGWFRPECEIKSHPLRAAEEAAKNLWKTPGGVFLILFIISASLFLMWWAFRCYRAKRCDWPWNVRRGSYASARYTKKQRVGTPREDSDDDVDVYNSPGGPPSDSFAIDGGVTNPAFEE
tara:strand:- start:6453 stop:6986 length:534 start_codon:yes stop_codon:yes gene_type:complete